jgi:hypothetical protein
VFLILCVKLNSSSHRSIKFKNHRKISQQRALREVRTALLDNPLNPLVLRQCCPEGDLLEIVASLKVPGLSGKYNLPPGSGPLKDGTPELIVKLRKAQSVSPHGIVYTVTRALCSLGCYAGKFDSCHRFGNFEPHPQG